MEGHDRPWCERGKVHPDTGELVPELPVWAEAYDLGGRYLGLIAYSEREYVESWARTRPPGSAYRVIVRSGGRMLCRMTLRVHAGGLISIEGTEVRR